ncbi:G-protein coupled receptor 35-like [Pelodytes ibericus]
MACFNTSEALDHSLQLLNLIVSIPLFFFGLICNIFALWVFCCKLKRTETSVFMVNLVISDITILFIFPFRIYAFTHTSGLGSKTCKALLLLYFTNTYMSIFTITAIAVVRYIAIRYPLKFQHWRSPQKATITCCALWFLVIVIGIVSILQNKDYTLTYCFQKVTDEPSSMALVFVVGGFILPLIIISYCSGQAVWTLRNKDTSDPRENRSIRKGVNIIVSNLIVFVVCFLPIHMSYTVRFVAENGDSSCETLEHINVYVHVTTLLANSNCVLDSVCYFFAASEFWNAIYK